MHRFRIDVLGPDATAAGEALETVGALPFGRDEPETWSWSSEAGWDALARFSTTLPSVPLAIEGFQEFEDELTHARVTCGKVRVIRRQGVLPSNWGSFHDEDAHPLERDLLVWAGCVIAADQSELEASALSCGLETAMVVGGELGRFVGAARNFLSADAPTRESLDAVVRLARTGLRVSAASQSRSEGELRYLLPLRLTQSVVHAGLDEHIERPGQADWQRWLGLLLGSTADLVSDMHEWGLTSSAPEPPFDPDSRQPDRDEAMELSARSLVTSCVQALALFGSEPAGKHGHSRYRAPQR